MAVRMSTYQSPSVPAGSAGSAGVGARRFGASRVSSQEEAIRPDRSRMDAVRRTVLHAQRQEVEAQIREKALARVEMLVRGMEALAQRMASKKVSPVRRSVLMSRFNDLQRQINRLDGIVGSEGQEVKGLEALRRYSSDLRRKGGDETPSQARIRGIRREIQAERQRVTARRREARQTAEQELDSLRPVALHLSAEQTSTLPGNIRSRGLEVIGEDVTGIQVDLQV